jgi:AcrR family transcriptional regulator
MEYLKTDAVGGFGHARAGILERLRARRAEIDQAIFARVSDRWFDRTGSGDPEYVAGLRAAGVAAVDYILVGVERSGVSLQPVPAAVLEQARRAARVGVGLETVLRRYLAGYAVLERFVIGEAERGEQGWTLTHPPDRITTAPGGVLPEVLQIVSVLVDRLVAAVSSAYSKEVGRAGEDVVGKGTSARERSDRLKSVVSEASAGSPERAIQSSRTRISQRERILEAMVQIAAERGFAGVSVKLLTARAGVSSRTFYEEFDGLQDCFVAVLELALERAGGLIVQAFVREEHWRDGVLGALASLLVFFDSEPARSAGRCPRPSRDRARARRRFPRSSATRARDARVNVCCTSPSRASGESIRATARSARARSARRSVPTTSRRSQSCSHNCRTRISPSRAPRDGVGQTNGDSHHVAKRRPVRLPAMRISSQMTRSRHIAQLFRYSQKSTDLPPFW